MSGVGFEPTKRMQRVLSPSPLTKLGKPDVNSLTISNYHREYTFGILNALVNNFHMTHNWRAPSKTLLSITIRTTATLIAQFTRKKSEKKTQKITKNHQKW